MPSLDKAFSDFLKALRGAQSYASLASKLGIAESTLYRFTNRQQSATLLLDLHGLTPIGISVSSILAAIGVAITTLLSTQATTLVSNALKFIVPPPIEEKAADAQQQTQPTAE